MASLKVKVRKLAIRLARRRPAPNVIPADGDRNYFSVYHEGTDWRALIKGIESRGLTAWVNQGTGPMFPASIPNVSLDGGTIRIVHHFCELEIEYSSPTKFIIHRAMRYHWAVLSYERTAQFLFNQKKLFQHDRMTVLRLFCDRSVVHQNHRAGVAEIITELHGHRSARHPTYPELYRHYRDVLDSLNETNDLEEVGNGNGIYRSAPRAIETLAHYKKERHNYRLKWVLTIATVLAVVVGALELFK